MSCASSTKSSAFLRTCLLISCCSLLLSPSLAQAANPSHDYAQIDSLKKTAAKRYCEAILAHENAEPFKYAFSALYLNRNLEEANQRILDEINSITLTLPINMHERDASGKARPPKTGADLAGNTELLPDQAGSEYVKWKMRLINRLYYFFNGQSSHYPGRLSAEAQRAWLDEILSLAIKAGMVDAAAKE